MPELGFLKVFAQAAARGTRSSALRPIDWLLLLQLGSLLGSLYLDAANWIVIFFVFSSALSFSLYLFTYVYLLFKDRDALRSETYSLHKLAIEKGLIGDSISGLIEEEKVQLLPKKRSDESENEK